MKQLLPQAQAEPLSEKLSRHSQQVDSLFVLDRRVDMFTPLLTQLTYEGLIDEFIGIEHCLSFFAFRTQFRRLSLLPARVELPSSFTEPTEAQQGSSSSATPAALAKEKKKKYLLKGSEDPLFSELRDLNFAFVGRELNTMARRLDEDVKAR